MNRNDLATLKDLEELRKGLIKDIRELIIQNRTPKKEFISPKEYSLATGTPYSTVIYRITTGQLAAHQEDIGCSWKILSSEIDKLKKNIDESTNN